MKTNILTTLLLTASAVTARRTASEVAKYDNVNAGVAPGLPVRGITPLGPYQDLFYSNMGVISLNTIGAGIDPKSPENVVAYDLIAQQQGSQNITSNYKDSNTECFNLKSFFLGCLVSTEETATSVPTACSISLTGYRHGKEVAARTVDFKPSGLRSKMQSVDLGRKFWGVDTVDFKTEDVVQSTTLGVLFDDVAYDVVLRK